MWMLLVARVWAVEPVEQPWVTARASLGNFGFSTVGEMVRLGVEGEVWKHPNRAFGARFTGGLDGVFLDILYSWTFEPNVTLATNGRIRAVGQVGAGFASQRFDQSCLWSCNAITGAWLPVATASVAGGIASRRSGTQALLRVEADTGGRIGVVPTFQFGAKIPLRSRAEDTAREDDRPTELPLGDLVVPDDGLP